MIRNWRDGFVTQTLAICILYVVQDKYVTLSKNRTYVFLEIVKSPIFLRRSSWKSIVLYA